MTLMSTTTNAKRYGIGFATIMLAALGIVLVSTAAMGAVATHTVAVDDPGNQSVEATLDFSASTDATVALESADGATTYDTATVSGAADATETVTLSTATAPAGDLSLNVTATDETAVSINETTLLTEETVSVANATTETVDVDVAYLANGTTDVEIVDDTGTTLVTDTLTYDGSDEDAVLSASYNGSDGIEAGNLTVTLATSPATAHDSAAIGTSAVNEATSGGGWMPDMSGLSVPSISVDAIPGGSAGLAGGAIVLILLAAAFVGRN